MQDSGFPLYKQLIERIKYYIFSGKLQIEQKIAPPKALAERLGINKNTIISAYKQLESEGLLVTKNGQGTYVSNIPEAWQNKKSIKQLITLAKDTQEKALALGFTKEEWFMVVFNQTILEMTMPNSIAFDWETVKDEQLTHMLYITDSDEPLEKIAKELRSYFLFHLPVKVCTIAELKNKLNDKLVVNAYSIYTLVHLAESVEDIVKPCKKNIIVLPYWMRAEYPW